MQNQKAPCPEMHRVGEAARPPPLCRGGSHNERRPTRPSLALQKLCVPSAKLLVFTALQAELVGLMASLFRHAELKAPLT